MDIDKNELRCEILTQKGYRCRNEFNQLSVNGDYRTCWRHCNYEKYTTDDQVQQLEKYLNNDIQHIISNTIEQDKCNHERLLTDKMNKHNLISPIIHHHILNMWKTKLSANETGLGINKEPFFDTMISYFKNKIASLQVYMREKNFQKMVEHYTCFHKTYCENCNNEILELKIKCGLL